MKKLRIIFCGGGTLGSVTPLIAVFQEIKKQRPEAEFLWLATRQGPELGLLKNYNIPIKQIFAGKLRRYFSWQNFFTPILIIFGFIQAFFIIIKFNPSLIVSAGGFVSVPVIWTGWLLLTPSLIHQQDVKPGLANKITSPFAKLITVSFEKSLKDFSAKKTVLCGNPVRPEIFSADRNRAFEIFNLKKDLPVLLVIGGGTGALSINNLVAAVLPELLNFCQVIHLTGKAKLVANFKNANYHPYEFLAADLKEAMAVADLVISRGGMGVLTEIAVLGKPMIIIPIPESHQKDNAQEFFRNNAALILEEKNLIADDLVKIVRELIFNQVQLQTLSRNISKMMPKDAAEKIVDKILEISS